MNERDELLSEIEPNLSRLDEIEQGMIARIKEEPECNPAGILYLKSVRNYLARPKSGVEPEPEPKPEPAE